MRIFYPLFFIIFLHFSLKAQTIDVSGLCITGTVVLSSISPVNGKPAYQGTGTVAGSSSTVSVYWLGAPDNVWVLDFDGQPYFASSCATAAPPGTSSSTCSWTEVTTGCSGGTALSISGSGVLPVRFISFTASEANGQVELNWKTGSELHNKGFQVQRSSDGVNWIPIGFVNGAINSSSEQSYHFTDAGPLNSKNYYRLVQYDLDDRKSYSLIVNVDLSGTAYYSISNNPGNGRYELTLRTGEPVEITVSDLNGRRLLSRKVNPGLHPLDLSQYATGTYLLQLKKGNETITEKLIKQ